MRSGPRVLAYHPAPCRLSPPRTSTASFGISAASFEDISVTINTGEHVGLVGANGSGKSTLVRIWPASTPPTVRGVHRSNGGEIVPVLWLTADRWTTTVPLPAGSSTLTIAPGPPPLHAGQHPGHRGQSHPTRGVRFPPVGHQRSACTAAVRGGWFRGAVQSFAGANRGFSGLQLVGSGVFFQFPLNTTLAPNQFLVLGNSLAAFQAEFGRTQFPSGIASVGAGVQTLAVVVSGGRTRRSR